MNGFVDGLLVHHPRFVHIHIGGQPRWVVERDFAWASRFRRLVRDYEWLPETVAGLQFLAVACLMLH